MFNQILRKINQIPKRELAREISQLAIELEIVVGLIGKVIREKNEKYQNMSTSFKKEYH